MGGSSPKTTTTTVDPVYNAGMLKLSQGQQGWAAEMFNQFKYGVTYNPEEIQKGTYINGEWVDESKLKGKNFSDQYYTESPEYAEWNNAYQRALADADQYQPPGVGSDASQDPSWAKQYMAQWLRDNPAPEKTMVNPNALQERTLGDIRGYDPEAQTSEMEYLQNLVESNQSLLGLQTDVGKKRLELADTYLTDVNKGIDIGERMNEAQASVQHGFKNARESMARNISSYGLDPNSSRFASQNRDLALSEATGVAGARTAAKNFAEEQDLERKRAGLQLSL